LDVLVKVKSSFFDRPDVMRRVKRGKRAALSRFGAFVRRRARSSIRKRKKISQPLMPPSSHEGSLRKLIFFAYDSKRDSVVIGPAPLNRFTGVPRLLEEGGVRVGDLRPMFYRPHPYMVPALHAERSQAAPSFRNSVR
jgi:hypothetical protein